MENTGKVLFSDETPQWFVALGNQWIGPLAATDVYQKVMRQEITWVHYVWRKGQRDWTRICDTTEFQVSTPAAPAKQLKEEVIDRSQEISRAPKAQIKQVHPSRTANATPARKAALPVDETPSSENPEAKCWYLFWNDTQYGPFSTTEITRMIESGRVGGRHYLWKEGMTRWEHLERLLHFAGLVKAAPTADADARSTGPARANKRQAPRKPLVAKIYLANEETVVTAVCRDISVGGMQVLTDRVPGIVGTRVKMNVSPAEAEKPSKPSKSEAGSNQSFKPFVAEGVIVRVLEDGRGFSFRFDKISDAAKRAINAYVNIGTADA
jgi:hypothetical protein